LKKHLQKLKLNLTKLKKSWLKYF